MKGEYLKEKRHKYTKYMCYRMDNSKYVAKVSPHHAHDKSIRMFLKDKAEAVNAKKAFLVTILGDNSNCISYVNNLVIVPSLIDLNTGNINTTALKEIADLIRR